MIRRPLATALLAATLAGCGAAGEGSGSSGSTAAATPSGSGSGTTVPANVRAQEAAIHAQVTAALQGAQTRRGRYGGLPGFLPRARGSVGRTLLAAPGHPVLAVEGDSVRLRVGSVSTLATAVGPAVPAGIPGSHAAVTPATFLVTFTATAGTLPLVASAFTIIDEQGHLHHPKLTARGGARPPRAVAAGATVTVQLHDVLPIGNGDLRFSPAGAARLVAWDFDVETD